MGKKHIFSGFFCVSTDEIATPISFKENLINVEESLKKNNITRVMDFIYVKIDVTLLKMNFEKFCFL